MKIFIAHLEHETNTFSRDRTDIERFGTGGYCEGEELRSRYADSNHYLGGMMKAAAESRAEVYCGISVATAGPLITRECLDYYVDRFCDRLIPYAHQVDGLCLALHGGGCAEGIDDIEGYMLGHVRDIVGMDMPITLSLDLHANVSQAMAQLSNGMIGLKCYPHIDCDAAGYIAMQILLQHLRGELKLDMHFVRLPLLLPFQNMATTEGIGKQMKDLVSEVKQEKGLIDATFFHGYPYADTPVTGAGVLVLAENDAAKYARQIAGEIWARRAEFMPTPIGVADAMRQACDQVEPGRTVILCETSDHGGAGGPNDGTHVLRELLKRDVPRSILVSIYDPDVADQAHMAGVDNRIDIRVGGKKDTLHGEPVGLQNVEVLGISDGHFNYTTPMYLGQPYSVGKTARLRSGNVEFVVCSVPRQTHDDRVLATTGAQVSDYTLVAIKSTIAFRAYFAPLPFVKAIVMTDPPGVSTCDLSALPFKRIHRPVYPLDPETGLSDMVEFRHGRS